MNLSERRKLRATRVALAKAHAILSKAHADLRSLGQYTVGPDHRTTASGLHSAAQWTKAAEDATQNILDILTTLEQGR